MQNFISKKLIISIIVISALLLFITIGFFIYNFWGTEYSKDINDWGAFRGYFGGIITVIFSISSFVILSFITIKINRQSYLKPKQWEAYEELMKNTISLRMFFENVYLV